MASMRSYCEILFWNRCPDTLFYNSSPEIVHFERWMYMGTMLPCFHPSRHPITKPMTSWTSPSYGVAAFDAVKFQFSAQSLICFPAFTFKGIKSANGYCGGSYVHWASVWGQVPVGLPWMWRGMKSCPWPLYSDWQHPVRLLNAHYTSSLHFSVSLHGVLVRFSITQIAMLVKHESGRF